MGNAKMRLYKHIRTIGILTLLFYISSCNITGDFAFSKRKYTNGYNLITPSLYHTSNTQSINSRLDKHDFKNKVNTTNDSDSLVKNDLRPTTSDLHLYKTVIPFKKVFIPPDTTKPQKKDTINAKDSTLAKNKTPVLNNQNNNHWYTQAIIAFIISCSLIFIPFACLIFKVISIEFVIFTVIFPIIGFVNGIRVKKEIKKTDDKKGLGFANASIYSVLVFYGLITLGLIGLFIYLIHYLVTY